MRLMLIGTFTGEIILSVFIDTGVIVAEANEKDSYHEKALAILDMVKSGAYGNWVCISDYVFDEALTLTFSRTGNMNRAKSLAKRLLASKGVNLLRVGEDVFQESVATFLSQIGELSFTDCTTVELMKQNGITYIATFDNGFKGIAGIKIVG